MKYLKLNEVRTKYWNELNGTRFNYTDILIAFEVVNQLVATPVTTIPDFNKLWESEIENAKGIIRDIHAELVGFDPFNVLEMTRRLFQYISFDVRVTTSKFHWSIKSDVMGQAKPYEFLNSSEVEEAKAFASRMLDVKNASIVAFTGVIGSMEYDGLISDFINDASNTFDEIESANTEITLSHQFEYARNIIVKYIEFISIGNSFNFPKHDGHLVDTFLTYALRTITDDALNESSVIKAIKELVE